jgi:uncharacterized protein
VDIEAILTNTVNSVDGALGAALGGMDGLLIEQYSLENSPKMAPIVAEHSNLLRSTKNAYRNTLGLGDIREVMIFADKIFGYTLQVTNDFFLTLVLEPKGNIGKARLMAEVAAKQIRDIVG